jgi:hypothetical protein
MGIRLRWETIFSMDSSLTRAYLGMNKDKGGYRGFG